MRSDEKEAREKYDLMAEEYHYNRTKKYPQGWFFNEMLEMPAVLELLGDIKNKKILDIGCGTGIYAKILTQKGAIVKGFDISPSMVGVARRENPKLDLRIGSANKIPFNEKFDIAFASLVVHYLPDWNKMLKEIRRVLKDDGIFIFSTGNPVAESVERIYVKGKRYKVLANYFNENKRYGSWKRANKAMPIGVPFYHITYETMIKRILNSSFEVLDYKDCFPLRKAKKYFPKEYEDYSNIPFFCVFKVRKK